MPYRNLIAILLFVSSTVTAEPPVEPTDSHGLPEPPVGSLVIGGGGELPAGVYQRFAELAGGAQGRLVVIPTATSDESLAKPEDRQWYLDEWKSSGFQRVTLLHTRDREEANRPEFVKPLREATAVWIGGGDQARLEAAFVGTAVEQEIAGVFARGGVIGGSSAGAAIQSKVMIRGGEEHSDLGLGFDLLPMAIVDQHFLKRNRLMRLLEAVRVNPDRLGVGIDERTAIVVRGSQIEVLGDSYVLFVKSDTGPAGVRIQSLSSGERYER